MHRVPGWSVPAGEHQLFDEQSAGEPDADQHGKRLISRCDLSAPCCAPGTLNGDPLSALSSFPGTAPPAIRLLGRPGGTGAGGILVVGFGLGLGLTAMVKTPATTPAGR
jgi:hypothetical protein